MTYELSDTEAIPEMRPLLIGAWVYDPPSGVFMNPALTAQLLCDYKIPLTLDTSRSRREYGRAVVLPFVNSIECANAVAPLLIELAASLPVVFATLDLRMTIADPIFARRPPAIAFYGTGTPR